MRSKQRGGREAGREREGGRKGGREKEGEREGEGVQELKCLSFCFGAVPGDAHGLPLALCSWITPSRLGEPYGMLEIGLAVSKANGLPQGACLICSQP